MHRINENMVYQNRQDTAKAMPKGIFMAPKAYIRKQERLQTNYLNFYLNVLETEQKINSKQVEGRKQQIRGEINETENKKTIEKTQ